MSFQTVSFPLPDANGDPFTLVLCACIRWPCEHNPDQLGLPLTITTPPAGEETPS